MFGNSNWTEGLFQNLFLSKSIWVYEKVLHIQNEGLKVNNLGKTFEMGFLCHYVVTNVVKSLLMKYAITYLIVSVTDFF